MRPLVIDEDARAGIARLLEYAQENRMPRYAMMARINQGEFGPAPGDDPNFCTYLQFGFKVVCTEEEHDAKWWRHISVSVADPTRVPSIEAVRMIGQEFGLKPLEECHVYVEDCFPKAVNVISPI